MTSNTVRLASPSVVIGLVLMGLMALPMSSCSGSGQQNELIPLEMMLDAAGANDSVPTSFSALIDWGGERLSSIALTFLFTWPYWTALPIVFAFPILWFAPKRATMIWRLMLLCIGLGVTWFLYESNEWAGRLVGVGGLLAVAVWCRSSSIFGRAIGWIWNRLAAQVCRVRIDHLVEPVTGGFQVTVVLCATAIVNLFLLGDALLIGGRLAAITNLIMACISIVSARQARRDPTRMPQIDTKDLLIATTLLAICFGVFWRL